VALRRYSLSEQAVEELRTSITSGTWPIGHKLPGETTLAASFGVGRSTIREAIRELAGKGLLESRQGLGVFVVSATEAVDWGDTLRRGHIIDVVECRLAIETEAARLAAGRRNQADLDAIESALSRRDATEAHRTDATFIEADLNFHRAVVEAAHNPVLAELFHSLTPRIQDAMADMLTVLNRRVPNHPTDQDAHRLILDAIVAGDSNSAAATSRAHLMELTQNLSHERA
jgi:DNA-binding FadR family transcriptional regulator